jgi:hypothetical protein
VWLEQACSYLRGADPVLARLIGARPDFDPRVWLARPPPMDLLGALLFQVIGQPADDVAVLSARARLLCRAACPSGLAADHRCRPVSTEIAPRRVRAQSPADRASWDGQLGGGTH